MSAVAPPAAYTEVPVFFEAGGETLFGIVTRPVHAEGRTAVVILPGGGTPLTTNRNRVSVRLCRELARRGYSAFRMDYHGTGESTGTVEFHLKRPFVEDVTAAVECLKSFGVERVVLLGSTCFGSRTALASAAVLEDVEEVVALATPLRDFAMGERHSMSAAARRGLGRYLLEAFRPRTIRGLFDGRSRRLYRKHARAKLTLIASRFTRTLPGNRAMPTGPHAVAPALLAQLERLVERKVPMLFVYGTEEDYYEEFLAASHGELTGLLARAGSTVRVQTVPGQVHGLAKLAVQEAVVELILEWADHRGQQTGAAEAAAARKIRA